MLASLASLGATVPAYGAWPDSDGKAAEHSDSAPGAMNPAPTWVTAAGAPVATGTHPYSPAGTESDAKEMHHPRDVDTPDERFPHFKTEYKDGKVNFLPARSNQLGVYECMNENWILPCIHTPLADGQCYNRNYGKTGSMGPDKGLTCTIYEQPDCNDKGWNTVKNWVWPGIPVYDASKMLWAAGMATYGPISIKCTHD